MAMTMSGEVAANVAVILAMIAGSRSRNGLVNQRSITNGPIEPIPTLRTASMRSFQESLLA